MQQSAFGSAAALAVRTLVAHPSRRSPRLGPGRPLSGLAWGSVHGGVAMAGFPEDGFCLREAEQVRDKRLHDGLFWQVAGLSDTASAH